MTSPIHPVLLLAATTLASASPDWPEFRGPTGQGISTAKNLPTTWDTKKGIAWKTAVPAGWASPVLRDGKIVLAASREKEGKTSLGLLQLDATTGKILWEQWPFAPTTAEIEARHAKNGLASATPVLADGRIYAHFAHMGTAALDFESGKVLWKRKFEYAPMHGTGSSPVRIDDLLVFHADAKVDPTLIAVHARDGSDAWRVPRNQEVKRPFSFCTPLAIQNNGRTELISPASGFVGAYAPEDGRLLWKVRYGEGYSVVPRPVFHNGLLFVASGFNRPNLIAIKPAGAKGDVTKSHVAWETHKWIPKTPSFVAADGLLYVLDDTGTLSCRKAASGDLLWREKLPGNFSASPVLAGNTLYLCTEDGVCFVIKVSNNGAEILSEIDMEEGILASPAAVDGALYLRSEKHLWKIQ